MWCLWCPVKAQDGSFSNHAIGHDHHYSEMIFPQHMLNLMTEQCWLNLNSLSSWFLVFGFFVLMCSSHWINWKPIGLSRAFLNAATTSGTPTNRRTRTWQKVFAWLGHHSYVSPCDLSNECAHMNGQQSQKCSQQLLVLPKQPVKSKKREREREQMLSQGTLVL